MANRMSPSDSTTKRKKPYDEEGMDPEMRRTLQGEVARRDTMESATGRYRVPWGWSWFQRKPKRKRPGPIPVKR